MRQIIRQDGTALPGEKSDVSVLLWINDSLVPIQITKWVEDLPYVFDESRNSQVPAYSHNAYVATISGSPNNNLNEIINGITIRAGDAAAASWLSNLASP